MNGQIIRLTYVALALVAALVVMTTYWQTWASAGLAARQDNAIRRVAEFSIDRGLIFSFEPRKRLARNRGAGSRREDALLPPLPVRPACGTRRRLLHGGPFANRPRALAERLPDGLEPEPLDPRRPGARRAAGPAGAGEQRRHHARSRRPGGGKRAARTELRRGRRARSAKREGPGHGVVAELRPECRRGALRPHRAASRPTARLQPRS